jgi:hypothetical protein
VQPSPTIWYFPTLKSATCFQTPSLHPYEWHPKFHTHRNQQVKLQFSKTKHERGHMDRRSRSRKGGKQRAVSISNDTQRESFKIFSTLTVNGSKWHKAPCCNDLVTVQLELGSMF